MFKILLPFALIALAVGQFVRPLVFRPYPENFSPFSPFINNNGQQYINLCTYNDVSYAKCIYTISAARNRSIPFALQCIQEGNRENCINSVKSGASDMVVLTGHGYKEARAGGLRPFIFAKEDDKSLYIAVAPRNITFIEVQEAPM